ncbi:MAG: ABC transporter permease [Spirochaetia bacterium]
MSGRGDRGPLKRRRLRRLLWILVIAGLWELISRLDLFPELLFPPLADILISLFRSLLGGGLLVQTGFSLLLILSALALSGVLTLILFTLSVLSRRLKDFFFFLQSFLHPLPGIALLPLFILWFGTGTPPVLIVIIHSVLWPLYTSLMGGYEALPRIWTRIGRNYMLGTGHMIRHIYLPGCMPSLTAGLKIGWARSWRALISAEMIFGAVGATGGLGWFLFQKRVFMDTPGLFAGLIMVAVIGLIVEDAVFGFLERKTFGAWGTGS